MRRMIAAVVFSVLLGLSQGRATASPQTTPPTQPPTNSANDTAKIIVPDGTSVVLSLTSPLWAKSVKVGDSIYASTAFPVAVDNQMAIPPGTCTEGVIDALTRPRLLSSHAELQIHFTKLIFANGYTIELKPSSGDVQVSEGIEPTKVTPAIPNVEPAVAFVYADVSARSDVLLDNGAQFEMILQTPLALDARSVAAAVRRSAPLQFSALKSSTRCVPTLGTPGTSDTVIPGTPGTPGTPDTVIPGGPGMPPTIIPGTPGTPGTPPTIIPGTPGTAGTTCPGPPIVTSPPANKDQRTKTFALTNSFQVGGVQLSPGTYQAAWTGMGPRAQVEILQNKKVVARAQAKVLILAGKSPDNAALPRANANGTNSLSSLRFAGEDFALFFD
jgi:hypothetical protein